MHGPVICSRPNAREAIHDRAWDGMVAHPVCTRMANSGAKHLYIGGRKENGIEPDRWAMMAQDASLYRDLRDAPIPLKAIENSVMHGHAIQATRRGRTQFVHPHFFGSPFFKNTGFEIIGYPPLYRTHYMVVPKSGTDEHKAWSRVHRMGPSADRGKERARLNPMMAASIAEQWSFFMLTGKRWQPAGCEGDLFAYLAERDRNPVACGPHLSL